MFNYHDTSVRIERENAGRDHCGSTGRVFPIGSLLLRDGRVSSPDSPNSLIDNTNGPIMIYAVNEAFDLNIAYDGVRGSENAVKHETLFNNADVRAAGEITFSKGWVISVNDHSGSYGCYGKLADDPSFAGSILRAVRRSGVKVKKSFLSELARKGGQR